MKISDRLSGALLALVGALSFWGGMRLPQVPGQPIGPSVFPMIVGAGMVVLGVLIALHVGRSFEDEAEADAAAHGDHDPEEARYADARRLHVLIPPALLVFYYLVSERIGFLPTAAVMIAVLAYAFDARRIYIAPLAVFGALFVQIVFLKLLRVPLPPMPFGF